MQARQMCWECINMSRTAWHISQKLARIMPLEINLSFDILTVSLSCTSTSYSMKISQCWYIILEMRTELTYNQVHRRNTVSGGTMQSLGNNFKAFLKFWVTIWVASRNKIETLKVNSQLTNSLNGQHLHVIWVRLPL